MFGKKKGHHHVFGKIKKKRINAEAEIYDKRGKFWTKLTKLVLEKKRNCERKMECGIYTLLPFLEGKKENRGWMTGEEPQNHPSVTLLYFSLK